MTPENIDFDLTEEEGAIRDLVHRYAEEVMRPAGQKLDQLPADDVIARDSVLWDVHAKWDQLGVRLFGDVVDVPVSGMGAGLLGCQVVGGYLRLRGLRSPESELVVGDDLRPGLLGEAHGTAEVIRVGVGDHDRVDVLGCEPGLLQPIL